MGRTYSSHNKRRVLLLFRNYPPLRRSQEKDFAVIPLLAGLRYYMKNKWYAAFETGVNMKAHSNAATKFTLVPSAGILWPVGKKAIDLGIQFSTVPMGYGFPEQKLLQRGGYSFLGLRAAWVF